MEHTIFGLIKKRGEIAGQHKAAVKASDVLKADLDAIDRALVLCGYTDDPKGIAPRGKYKQLGNLCHGCCSDAFVAFDVPHSSSSFDV